MEENTYLDNNDTKYYDLRTINNRNILQNLKLVYDRCVYLKEILHSKEQAITFLCHFSFTRGELFMKRNNAICSKVLDVADWICSKENTEDI